MAINILLLILSALNGRLSLKLLINNKLTYIEILKKYGLLTFCSIIIWEFAKGLLLYRLYMEFTVSTSLFFIIGFVFFIGNWFCHRGEHPAVQLLAPLGFVYFLEPAFVHTFIFLWVIILLVARNLNRSIYLAFPLGILTTFLTSTTINGFIFTLIVLIIFSVQLINKEKIINRKITFLN